MNDKVKAHMALVTEYAQACSNGITAENVMAADAIWQAIQASAFFLQAEQAEPGFVMVPVDMMKVIHDGFALFKYAQGTKECIAFNRGVRYAEQQHAARPSE